MQIHMIYLQSLRRKHQQWPDEGFPFTLPVVRELESPTFRAPVTFFVGENGTGKSTILEAVATGVGAITEVAYDAVENVTLTRRFLAHPDVFLRHL